MRWRMISCPAAKPMRWVKPSIATVSPSRTSSAIASRIDATLRGHPAASSLAASAPAVDAAPRRRPLGRTSSGRRPRRRPRRRSAGRSPSRPRETVSAGDIRTLELAALEDEQAALEAGPLDLLGVLGRVELDAEHQALAADVADEPVEALDQRPQPGQRLLAARGGVGDEAALEQVDRRQGRGAGDRVAAVRRAVRARRPTTRGGRRGRSSPPSGMPEAMPLAVSRMSGSTPQCSTAHIFPVRPAPDWISSAMSRMPWRSQMLAEALRGSRPRGRCSRPRPGSARR